MIKETEIDTDLLFKQLVILPADRINTIAAETAAETKPGKIDSATEEKPNETPGIIRRPFAILTTESVKTSITTRDSNFLKIITSQKIANVNMHVVTQFEIDQQLHSYDCLWAIGLTPQQEQDLLKLKHSNILISPNMETLVSKEDKLSMFNPLTKFVRSNLELLSQL